MTVRGASLADAVGRTPLIRLARLERECPGVELWAKLELQNPGGSVKDRPALQMLLDAESAGRLRAGMSIIESTSGNTGIALAMYGGARGYPVTLVMPENVSVARKRLAAAYGAAVIYTDAREGSDGALRHVRQLVEREPSRYFYTDQYSNPSNPRAHYRTTAPEILAVIGDRLTHFVTGVGTSGTLMGAARRFREHDQRIRVVAVEPDAPAHGLEGLKHLASSIVPRIYDPSLLDETLFVDTAAGWRTAERLYREEGLHVGHSSGGNVEGALRIARRVAEAGQRAVIATILCDHAARYVES